MARKRLVGPSVRQVPMLDEPLAERTGDDLEDHEAVEDVRWDGGAPASVVGVEIARSRLTGLRLTGLELTDLRLVDVVLADCELSDGDLRGSDLYGARVTRSAFRRCDLTEVDVSASDFEAVPILATRRIGVDDDPPDLTEGG